ncbi:hypothetical protein Adeg_2166 (plasmid) [Ammonifex degensii KC4]|uniref:Uncharacterized protein n=1 Tax=Ammonifex degensii (strain DSM 10501 / KC4) TaxID=429009 RepID=C9RDH2_AMMDK|nr:hypothetical protein Adeg_2166 [Ammonifex degensii KC4]
MRLVVLRDPGKVWRVVRSLRRLVDRYREDLLPSEFWREGTYLPFPRYPNAYLLILWPPGGTDPVALARRVARLLEKRAGVVLDWAAGIRKSGAVWLLVKARAYKEPDLKVVRYGVQADDLRAIRRLV